MVRRLYRSAVVLAVVALAGVVLGPARAQTKVDHPRLRAALHELREARTELKDAKDIWPPGYRDRALQAINEAIESVRTILAVKDVDTFRGVDRSPDYYQRFKDHPRLRAALSDLRDARDELQHAKADAGNLKERALDDIDVAVGAILTLIHHNKKK